MAPFDVRPTTAGDPAQLRSGQRAPVVPDAGARVGAGPDSAAGVARPVQRLPVYDANPDGPWARSRQEWKAEGERLYFQRCDVRYRADQHPGQLPVPRARYVLGVVAAFLWTGGARDRGPATGRVVALGRDAVADEAMAATRLVAQGPRDLAPYADGVLAWLDWLRGRGGPVVPYPVEDSW